MVPLYSHSVKETITVGLEQKKKYNLILQWDHDCLPLLQPTDQCISLPHNPNERKDLKEKNYIGVIKICLTKNNTNPQIVI